MFFMAQLRHRTKAYELNYLAEIGRAARSKFDKLLLRDDFAQETSYPKGFSTYKRFSSTRKQTLRVHAIRTNFAT